MTRHRPALASLAVLATLSTGAVAVRAAASAPASPAPSPTMIIPHPGADHATTDQVVEHGGPAAVGPCETRVTESIREAHRGTKLDVLFTSDAQVVRSGGEQLEVKGDGRFTGGAAGAPAVAFRYTCTFDEHTRKPTGVVFHETDNRPPPPLSVSRADPMLVLPETCETAMATSLRAANPRAASIAFDGTDRKLEPLPGGGTALSGVGTIVRGPGLSAAAFHYRCDYDANGRVTAARQVD